MDLNEKLALVQKAKKKSNFKFCLYPDKRNCTKNIIKAHSIQNKKIIERLCDENGQVLMPDIDVFKNAGLNLKPFGKKIASTFTGLCSYHDNLLFKSIEENEYKMGKNQDVFFALRSVIKELYAKKRATKFLNAFAFDSDMARMFQLGHIKAEQDLNTYLDEFHKNITKNNFSFIDTKIVVFNKEYPFALNSCINLTHDFTGKKIDDLSDFKNLPKSLFINVFPQKNKTYILMSFLTRYKKHFRFLDEQLINKSENVKKIRLTNMITLNAENIVISPKYWQSFSVQEKLSYKKLSMEQIAWKQPDPSLLSKNNFFTWFKDN